MREKTKTKDGRVKQGKGALFPHHEATGPYARSIGVICFLTGLAPSSTPECFTSLSIHSEKNVGHPAVLSVNAYLHYKH